MVRTGYNAVDGVGSPRLKGVKRAREECKKKYTRYKEEQIDVLERVFAQCPNPSKSERLQIMSDHPALKGIDSKHLKIWFQNRRCREKQQKENGEVVAENMKLTALLKLLKEENKCLQKKAAQLIRDNEYLRNQVLSLPSTSAAVTDLGHAPPEPNSPRFPVRVADHNNNRLLILAHDTRREFLSKATGTAINWIPTPQLKLPCPISVGTIYISSTCIGVAARACTIVPFEPIKIIEILKDRLSWCRACRSMDVLEKHHSENGGTIELIYTRYYSSTSMTCARDFWTLRYTFVLDDGSFVVCEKSVSGSDVVPSSPPSLEFVRGKILASGYLVRPCEGGSTIHLVEHWDLESSSVPELVRPLHESPTLLAKKMIVPALQHIEHVASEARDKRAHAYVEDPTFLRSFPQRLTRAFNDAINGFTEDGWTFLQADASDNVIVSVKRTTTTINANYDSVICVKASLVVQNVFPAALVKILKEHRSAWMGFDFAHHSAAFSGAACYAFPGLNTHNLSETVVHLGKTNQDEILEIARFERTTSYQFSVTLGDLYHLQICSGLENAAFGVSSELIFAPIDRTTQNDALLLSSGFRIFLMDSNTGSRSSTNLTPNHPCSLSTLAFQFPFESHLQEGVIAMAKQYTQHVISSVKYICTEAMSIMNSLEVPSGSVPAMNYTEVNPVMRLNITPDSTSTIDLASLIFQSYRLNLGMEMGGSDDQRNGSLTELMQHHKYAILCFSPTSIPMCMYANRAALNMLQTTTENLKSIAVDRILDGTRNISLDSVLPILVQQGYAILPSGYCLSVMNHWVFYEQAVVWPVQALDRSIRCIALAFINWSFAGVS